MDVIYYDLANPKSLGAVRGTTRAWWIRQRHDRPWDERFGEFDIEAPLFQALFHLELVDRLLELPHEGLLGAYEEGALLREGLERAAEILEDQARGLGANTYDWLIARQVQPERIEYRIRVEAETLRRQLEQLARFLREGAHQGYDVQLWL